MDEGQGSSWDRWKLLQKQPSNMVVEVAVALHQDGDAVRMMMMTFGGASAWQEPNT